MSLISISSTLALVLLFLVDEVKTAELVFKGSETWNTWQTPHGLTEIGDDGQLRLVKYRKD